MRNYVRITGDSYTSAKLDEAAARVRNKELTLDKAVDLYKIPKTTIWRHSKLKPDEESKVGRPTALSKSDEKRIVYALKILGECGFGMNVEGLKNIIQSYVESGEFDNPFKNNRPGDDWVRSFKKRWSSELSFRVAQNLPANRASNANQKTVDHFFDLLEKKLNELEILNSPMNIWNTDETNLQASIGRQRVFCRRGSKNVQILVGDNEKTGYTVLSCVNACGIYMPPYVVYKSLHLYDTWVAGGPDGAMYNNSPSGWMEESQFFEWLKEIFVPNSKKYSGKHLLIFDGHNSHISVRTIELAIENNITLLCLPAHTTHILQPLDVSVFKSVKVNWRKILTDFFQKHKFQNVTKEKFPSLLKLLYENSFKRIHSINGFEETGIFPFNRTKISAEKLAISFSYEESDSEREKETPAERRKKSKTEAENIKQVSEKSEDVLKAVILNHIQTTTDSKERKKRLERPLAEAVTEKYSLDQMKARESIKKNKIENKKRKSLKKSNKKKTKKRTNNKAKKAKIDNDSEEEEDDIDEADKENRVADSQQEEIDFDDKKCFKCKVEIKKVLRSDQLKWQSCENCSNWACYTCVNKLHGKLSSDEFYCSNRCKNL